MDKPVVTMIYVLERTAIDFATDEKDLELETFGADSRIPVALPKSAVLEAGIYRVRSNLSEVGVTPTGDNVVVEGKRGKDGWPTPPPKAVLDNLGSRAAELEPFRNPAKAASVAMKRALVVGSQIRGLSGPDNDVAAMAALLGGLGFDVDQRIAGKATRAGILRGYRRLIDESNRDDTAVVYFSGHGAYASLADETLQAWQHILPTDYDDSSAADWRGITAWELSLLQQELTTKTKNVTVILDCCHSEQMSRDAAAQDAVARAVSTPNVQGFRQHLEALQRKHPTAAARLNPSGNPDAIRLVGCSQSQSAYEYVTSSGRCHGALTEALIDVVSEIGRAPISWRAIAAAVRTRVQHRFPSQRPDVEGPIRRLMFEVTEHDDTGAAAIRAVEGGFELSMGRLHGVTEGDVYAVMPVGSLGYDAARSLGELEVKKAGASTSLARRSAGTAAFGLDAVAVPLRKLAPRRAVALDAAEAEWQGLADAIAATKTLRVAERDEPGIVATLVARDGELTIADRDGPLFKPVSRATELGTALRNLANLGVAQAVRDLEGQDGVSLDEVVIELGAVVGDKLEPLPDHGGSLGTRDRIYIRLGTNAVRTLYFHVFSLGIDGEVRLLTSFAPSGVGRKSGATDYVFAGAPGDVTGLGIGWPAHTPRDVPRIDELLVVVTTQPTSLQGLETPRDGQRGIVRGQSKLGDLVAQLHDGAYRNVLSVGPGDHYLAKRLSFLLHPRDQALRGLAFDVDDNPTDLGGARSAAAWDLVPARPSTPAPAPDRIAIRLGDLVVLDNRALFRTKVRIDAIITTRSGTGAPVTWTATFDRITDGEQLPLRNAILFHGPVHDFVDIALFVSRDAEPSLALAQLFEREANSPELKDAATALALTAGAAAAPWVAAVGASAVLARIAYRLVLGVAGTSIGMYRTSFIAREQFGVGRHPTEGLYRAQDFAFSLTVEPA
jgi:hypothetical protein